MYATSGLNCCTLECVGSFEKKKEDCKCITLSVLTAPPAPPNCCSSGQLEAKFVQFSPHFLFFFYYFAGGPFRALWMSTHRHNDTFVQFTHRRGNSRKDCGGRQAANLNFCGQPDVETYIYIFHRYSHIHIYIYIYVSQNIYIHIHQSAHDHNIFGNRARTPRTLITC